MRRRIGFLLIFGSALSLAVASYAWACGNLVTLVLNEESAAPGGTVTFQGANYSNNAGVSDVVVHLGGRDGPPLWSGPPVARKISASFTVPAGTAPGYYTLVATQYQSTAPGALPVSGAPGRARLQVTGAAAEPAGAEAAAPADSAAPAAAAVPAAGVAPAASAAPAPSSRPTATKKKSKAKKKSKGRRKKSKPAAVAPWGSATPPSAPGPSEASSARAGSLSASATLPGILVALVMLPTGLLLVRSRGGQRTTAA